MHGRSFLSFRIDGLSQWSDEARAYDRLGRGERRVTQGVDEGTRMNSPEQKMERLGKNAKAD